MTSVSLQNALNGVLRIDPGEGFFLEVEHATYGTLVLPVEDPETLLRLEKGSKKSTVPALKLKRLEESCRQYADGANYVEGYQTAQSFAERYPLAHRAYYLQSVFSEQLNGLAHSARLLRQAIAIEPSFFYLAELGRVLGRLGRLEESRIVLKHLLESRSSADSKEAWERMAQDYLVTLTRLQRGSEMVEVADTVMGVVGESVHFQYQAILGLMIQEKFRAASERLESCRPRLKPRGQLANKFVQMEQILAAKLSKENRGEPEASPVDNAKLREVNEILKLEPQGFTVVREHARHGTLVLPMDHCLVTSQEELEALEAPTSKQEMVLSIECRRHVDRGDYKAAHVAAGNYLLDFPLSVYAHQRQGEYSESQRNFEEAARHLRKAIALEPDFRTLKDLGRVLYRAGHFQESATLLGYVFSIRSEEKNEFIVAGLAAQYLAALAKLRRGKELLAVAQAAIDEVGTSPSFEYYAALGEVLLGHREAAGQRLASFLDQCPEEHLWRKKFEELSAFLVSLPPKTRVDPKGV